MNDKLTIKNNSKSRRGFLGDITKWIGGTALLAATANVFTSNKVMADTNSPQIADTDFLGSIGMVGFNFAPRGYANCDGTLLAISQYSALFSLLGTIYGGDGRTTFALPDLRGRVPMHVGQGPGLTTRTQGQIGGTETNTLTTAQMPEHSHAFSVNSAGGTSDNPVGNYIASNSEGIKHYSNAAGSGEFGNGIGNTGEGQAQNNMQPYLVIRFVIALQGIFPSRN